MFRMAAGTQGSFLKCAEPPLAPREEFCSVQNGREDRNGVSELFRDAVFAVFDAETFVLTPFHSFTPYSLTPSTPSP